MFHFLSLGLDLGNLCRMLGLQFSFTSYFVCIFVHFLFNFCEIWFTCIFFKRYKPIISMNIEYRLLFQLVYFLCHLVCISLLTRKFQQRFFLLWLCQIFYCFCYCLFLSKLAVNGKVRILMHSFLLISEFSIFWYSCPKVNTF